MSKPRFYTLIGMIFVAALSRLVPHPWNFSPVAAMGLFAGAHFSKLRTAFLVPLIALVLSDLFLGTYPEMVFVYGSFMLIVLLGRAVKTHKTVFSITAASLTGSVLFFVITNFGTWLVSGMYPMNGAGLAACYTAALPFFRHTLGGDLFFAAILFGAFAFAEHKVPSLKEQPAR